MSDQHTPLSAANSASTSSTMTAVDRMSASEPSASDAPTASASSQTRAPPPTSTSTSTSTGKAQRTQPSASSSSDGAPLQRVTTSSSMTHAHNSLRRMATHETGEFVCQDRDGAEQLDTHDEHEQEDEHDHSSSSTAHEDELGRDEEEKIASKHPRSTGGAMSAAGEADVNAVGPEEKPKKKKKRPPELQDQTNLLPTKQVILVMVGLSCALFCSLLDQTIVVTALPTLGKVFHRADIAPWVGTAYLLTSTSMQPIYGRLSDIFGRKFVLLASLAIFLIGSLACALAQSMIELIVFRAIQGIGGGGILTLSMIIVSDVVSLRDRGKYQGLIGGVVAISNSLGPILGGIFTQSVTWRWCFYINLPLSGLAILIVIFVLPLKRVKGSMIGKLKVLDWYGSILTLAWAILVLLALSWAGNEYSWKSAGVLAPLLIGLALLGAFIVVEAKVVRLPLVPMRIFKTSTVSAAIVTTFFNGIIFYSSLYYLPSYFQVVRGDSAIRSGVLLLPLVLVQTCVSFMTGFIQSKTGDYWYNLIIGFSIWTVGLGLLSTIDIDTSIAKLVGFQILTGIGSGQTFQTSLVAIQASVAREDVATATGIRNFMRMLGGTLGLAVCSVLINNIVRKELKGKGVSESLLDQILADPTTTGHLSGDERSAVLHAYARGVQACFQFLIPLSAISVILTVIFIKRVSLRRDDDAQRKAEGKAWVEAKKAKKRAKKHHGEEHLDDEHSDEHEDTPRESRDVPEDTMRGEKSAERPVTDGIELGLEEAGRGEEEAAGLQPDKEEPRIGGSEGPGRP